MRLRTDWGCTFRTVNPKHGMRPARRRTPMRLRRWLPLVMR